MQVLFLKGIRMTLMTYWNYSLYQYKQTLNEVHKLSHVTFCIWKIYRVLSMQTILDLQRALKYIPSNWKH